MSDPLVNPDQPPPTPATGDVWLELIQMCSRDEHLAVLVPEMEERRRLGIERYGVPLQRGNGRDHKVDAAQELLDAVAYLWAYDDTRLTKRVLSVLLDLSGYATTGSLAYWQERAFKAEERLDALLQALVNK